MGDSTNTIIGMNAKRRHFRRRVKKNPAYARNPGGFSMKWVLLAGAAFLFLTPSGKALAARFTGGGGIGLPAGVPAGSVRLPDGTYRTPTGQIIGTPTSGAPGYLAPLASLVPGVATAVGGWLSSLFSGSSATTGAIITTAPPSGDPTTVEGSGGWLYALPPLPPLPDLTLGSPGTIDFWSATDTSGWWGNLGAPLDPLAGPVPTLDLTLTPLVDPWSEVWATEGLMGLGAAEIGPVSRYRFRQPPSFR